jgi:hypothetical protein
MKPIVIIESPFAGDVEANRLYLRRCLADSLQRGEAPFASHGLYPGALDDNNPEERELGITAGYEFWRVADKIVFYTDLGVSPGMSRAWERAMTQEKMTVETRRIGAHRGREDQEDAERRMVAFVRAMETDEKIMADLGWGMVEVDPTTGEPV